MEFQEIRKMAKTMDINTYHMRKVDMIRAIQDVEQNIPCFRYSEAGLLRRGCMPVAAGVRLLQRPGARQPQSLTSGRDSVRHGRSFIGWPQWT